MKTATEAVQEFLFKDKPKRSYCKKYDVQDLVNLLQNFGAEGKKEGITEMAKACEKAKVQLPRDGGHVDRESIREIRDELISKL